jgi:hypothetical protein
VTLPYDPARRSDPSTSHAAAASIVVADMELIVLRAIGRGGQNGKTWMEQEQSCSLPRQTISPRWRPLSKKGLIEARYNAQGQRITRPGWSSRQQTVWFITPAGSAILRLKLMDL